jgi:hypothetical protein
MISARRNADGSFEVVTGHMQLKVQLQLHGKAEVVEIGAGETVHVHEVDGKMVAISDDAQANVEDLANAAINRARR